MGQLGSSPSQPQPFLRAPFWLQGREPCEQVLGRQLKRRASGRSRYRPTTLPTEPEHVRVSLRCFVPSCPAKPAVRDPNLLSSSPVVPCRRDVVSRLPSSPGSRSYPDLTRARPQLEQRGAGRLRAYCARGIPDTPGHRTDMVLAPSDMGPSTSSMRHTCIPGKYL
ncbi:hypothetical protein EV356DRAFT_512951 [Viridothelium virens]|uniref:Uncharacterized protein n=1 Tax=Viridothelium virens TaxID=1048519 RepID=A0A6A6HDY9_VIRVR|nr:hypothetical protein EV356DRAFT_512951 [Viridothelium virens]